MSGVTTVAGPTGRTRAHRPRGLTSRELAERIKLGRGEGPRTIERILRESELAGVVVREDGRWRIASDELARHLSWIEGDLRLALAETGRWYGDRRRALERVLEAAA
jgi:hypothetical protein